jgi:hypothetical protein
VGETPRDQPRELASASVSERVSGKVLVSGSERVSVSVSERALVSGSGRVSVSGRVSASR